MSSTNPSSAAAPLRAMVSPNWSTELPDARVVVLLLHGYGADERDLVGLVEPLGIVAPWASLRAPLSLGGMPGAAWFPIEHLETLPVTSVESATAHLWTWIAAAVPARARVLPIGLSPGGLMATQLLRPRPARAVAPGVLAG